MSKSAQILIMGSQYINIINESTECRGVHLKDSRSSRRQPLLLLFPVLPLYKKKQPMGRGVSDSEGDVYT